MVMLLIVPLSEMPPLVDQLVVVKSEFCCNVQPVEGDGQETVTLFPEWVMVNNGAPDVCNTPIKLQNPPVSE